MRVDASALGVSNLIQSIFQVDRARSIVEMQLESLGVDMDWLLSTADRYRAFWEQTFSPGAGGQAGTVDEYTVLLLSWLLAPLREPDANAQLAASTFALSSEAFAKVAGPEVLPPQERLSVTIGVVGRPIPVIDRDFPSWLPGRLLDRDVELAYEGLLEHVAVAPSGEWPEVHRTAVLWRLGGIAQGLVGGSEDVWKCMKDLNLQLSSALPVAHRRMTADDWMKTYRANRNVFTHVRPEGERSFHSALAEHSEANQLIEYVRLATYYAAVSMNVKLSAIDSQTASRWLDVVDRDQSWVSAVA